MTKPAAIRALTIIAWVRIAFAILLVGLFLYFATDARPQSRVIRGVRAGFLQGAGVANPARFTDEDAGEASFRPIMTVVLSAVFLVSIRRRRLVAARVSEGMFLLLSLLSPAMLLSIVVLSLLFTPSVVQYFRGSPRAVAAIPLPERG